MTEHPADLVATPPAPLLPWKLEWLSPPSLDHSPRHSNHHHRHHHHHHDHDRHYYGHRGFSTRLVHAQVPLSAWLQAGPGPALSTLVLGADPARARTARVALADWMARYVTVSIGRQGRMPLERVTTSTETTPSSSPAVVHYLRIEMWGPSSHRRPNHHHQQQQHHHHQQHHHQHARPGASTPTTNSGSSEPPPLWLSSCLNALGPFMLERSDIYITPIYPTRSSEASSTHHHHHDDHQDDDTDDEDDHRVEDGMLHLMLRVILEPPEPTVSQDEEDHPPAASHLDEPPVVPDLQVWDRAVTSWLDQWLVTDLAAPSSEKTAHSSWSENHQTPGPYSWGQHVATAVFQHELRQALIRDHAAVAFIAQGSILPRKSGASAAPMSSPPALPFQAPPDSSLQATLSVSMPPILVPFLPPSLVVVADRPAEGGSKDSSAMRSTAVLQISGLLIPQGVSLIVGGGYHGKSTMLRCLAAGIYNKIPGDGREFCVTVDRAVTVRAEDGRYVHNCNISAFIANLPTLPGLESAPDTTQFSTREASGSTSQAANVVEAIELGAQALLVDEDVSAANFMARDGRMRSLVMDESITPLLYRVNGLYDTLGISSMVVVGGVGDWLDVPHHVLLMDKYQCFDATLKARSISRQFSHGHVEYAGRGVVHRLPWPASGTPLPRRPQSDFCQRFPSQETVVELLDGLGGIVLRRLRPAREGVHHHHHHHHDEDDDGYMDLSRCEQLLGKKHQVYGCGLAVLWVLQQSLRHPERGLPELLRDLDRHLDRHGIMALLRGDDNDGESSLPLNHASLSTLLETLGFAYRPRSVEVGQALLRLRGLVMEKLPEFVQAAALAEAAAAAEEERKKRELMEMWNNRRQRQAFSSET